MTPDQVAFRNLWDVHVNHVPVLTGGTGHDELEEFYSSSFIPQMPPNTESTPMSRTVSTNQLVDEMISSSIYTVPMARMLPGVAPTGKRVEVPTVAVIGLRDGKFTFEHLYQDQASVLVRIGLLDADTLPIVGVESARELQDPTLPSNPIWRARWRCPDGASARAEPSSLDDGLPRTLCLCGCSARYAHKLMLAAYYLTVAHR